MRRIFHKHVRKTKRVHRKRLGMLEKLRVYAGIPIGF